LQHLTQNCGQSLRQGFDAVRRFQQHNRSAFLRQGLHRLMALSGFAG
jgi:hypothetical protein